MPAPSVVSRPPSRGPRVAAWLAILLLPSVAGGQVNPFGQPARVEAEDPAVPGAAVASGPAPAPRLIHPQPDLSHATQRYEVTYAVAPGDAVVLGLLDETLPRAGVEIEEQATVRLLADWLSRSYQMPVTIDLLALEDLGLDSDTPLPTAPKAAIGLRAALNLMLEDTGLGFTVERETLVLTSREAVQERLIVGLYPLPTQVSGALAIQGLVDTIEASVAVETWDTVGGPGSIRPVPEANELVVSQTLDVHERLVALMRTAFDADLADAARGVDVVPVRIHRLHDAALAQKIETGLVTLCNAALGKQGDPTARVSRLGDDRLVIQSASRPFQVYAAEMVRSLDGVEVGGVPVGGPGREP